jgi:hypothetical protein
VPGGLGWDSKPDTFPETEPLDLRRLGVFGYWKFRSSVMDFSDRLLITSLLGAMGLKAMVSVSINPNDYSRHT